MLEVAALPAHRNGYIKVELDFARSSDEGIELLRVLELCIAIQKQGSVISSGFSMLMEFFQILNHVVNPLSVKEFPNDLRRLSVVDSTQVLLHSCIVVALLIQKVAILAKNDVLLYDIDSRLLRKIDGKDVEVALVQDLKFLLLDEEFLDLRW